MNKKENRPPKYFQIKLTSKKVSPTGDKICPFALPAADDIELLTDEQKRRKIDFGPFQLLDYTDNYGSLSFPIHVS